MTPLQYKKHLMRVAAEHSAPGVLDVLVGVPAADLLAYANALQDRGAGCFTPDELAAFIHEGTRDM